MCARWLAEADGNRTRQTELLGLVGFEGRDAHQDAYASELTTNSHRGAYQAARKAGRSHERPTESIAVAQKSPTGQVRPGWVKRDASPAPNIQLQTPPEDDAGYVARRISTDISLGANTRNGGPQNPVPRLV